MPGNGYSDLSQLTLHSCERVIPPRRPFCLLNDRGAANLLIGEDIELISTAR